MSVLLHNVTVAVGDTDLVGGTLMIPVRKCINGYQYALSNLDPCEGIYQKTAEVFKRSLVFLLATLAVLPSTTLASAGSVSKLIDLYRKFDEKVSNYSEVSSYIPPILEPFSRTGDLTTAYLRARITADKAGMLLYYRPFKGSEMFAFDKLERNRDPKYYRKIVYLNTSEQVQDLENADKTQSVLYRVPFAPFNRELDRESKACSYPKYQPDWTQHEFRLQELLRIKSDRLSVPRDAYAVGLHIRDGGTYDDNNTKTLHPLKLPPLNFYIHELIKVIQKKSQEGHKKFFIHIFTDAIHPEDILEQVRSEVSRELRELEGFNLNFSFTPRADVTLKYDAGNMNQFQCMIRADSNLSGPIVAASNTELDIFPSGFDIKNSEIIISEVTQKEKNGNKERQHTHYSKPMQGWLPNWFNRFFYGYFGVHRVSLEES